MVSAVPLFSAIAFLATRVENSGESEMTTIPQNRRNTMSNLSDPEVKMNGETRQQIQEQSRERKAMRFGPHFSER